MDASRGAVWATALFVLAASIASGPLVGAVDLTPPDADTAPPPGTGSASITVLSVPDSAALVRGAFGSGTYHLEAPPAVVRVRSVRGNPELNYAIDIPGLGIADINSYRLAGRAGERLRLDFRPFEIRPGLVRNDSYGATLSIWLRTTGGRYEQLYSATITVEVRR